ncbi:hypothetical protein SCLCIDRAFT_212665 [Scleroderma citrinum Foug A]|uniref:Copper acquisition factor BIM1-like domain-containing protein n=1 Tax=Scleroderma citrinum Foug A TaxID=1036808 RepID=A0A0C3EGB3_9AGAM|nr:hypothetical protein SCLCIDRAFT_212665 [Scleroderma citrinum Foug A]
MHLTTLFPLALAAVASAHIQILYPPPRGPFIASQEPSFCDGFTNATSNRTLFPLNDGMISFKTGHPLWTLGFIVSTKTEASSFSDFNTSSGYQITVPFVEYTGSGQFCLPINLANSGISGIQEGANVTIQAVFDGGDGSLYQVRISALHPHDGKRQTHLFCELHKTVRRHHAIG